MAASPKRLPSHTCSGSCADVGGLPSLERETGNWELGANLNYWRLSSVKTIQRIIPALILVLVIGAASAEETDIAENLVADAGQSTANPNSPTAVPAQATPPPPPDVYQPLTSGGKFAYAIRHSILSPTAYLKAVAGAGYSMAINNESERGYGWGGEGFGRRVAHRMGKTTVHHLTGSWLAASALREDPRYHPSSSDGAMNRALYAASRVFVTRTDDGGDRFNTHNFIGIAASNGAATAWRPRESRGDVAKYFSRFATSLMWSAIGNLQKEFFRRR
jgi:hypothetical protein